jgi:hypothetical protein
MGKHNKSAFHLFIRLLFVVDETEQSERRHDFDIDVDNDLVAHQVGECFREFAYRRLCLTACGH